MGSGDALLKILDLFAGLGGENRRKAIEARGHSLVTLDYDARFNCNITMDIRYANQRTFIDYGRFDFIWASPPCEAFSVASIGHHWGGGHGAYEPKTEHAKLSLKSIIHTLELMKALDPKKGWILENPRGVLRKLTCMMFIPRATVTYCQYGAKHMKPTDLWGTIPRWVPRPMCKNGHSCHESAPRGSKTGTQGIKDAAERAVVPWELWEEILEILEKEN